MAGNVVAISSELPPRTSSVFMPQQGAEEPTGGSQSVRSSYEGRENRLEPRDAGKWMREGTNERNTTSYSGEHRRKRGLS